MMTSEAKYRICATISGKPSVNARQRIIIDFTCQKSISDDSLIKIQNLPNVDRVHHFSDESSHYFEISGPIEAEIDLLENVASILGETNIKSIFSRISGSE